MTYTVLSGTLNTNQATNHYFASNYAKFLRNSSFCMIPFTDAQHSVDCFLQDACLKPTV